MSSENRSFTIHYVALLGLLCTAFIALPAAAQEFIHFGVEEVPDLALSKKIDSDLYRYQTLSIDTQALAKDVQPETALKMMLGSQRFDLILEPAEIRSPDFVRIWTTDEGDIVERPETLGAYRGRLADDPESHVRLVILPDSFGGYIKTRDFWYFIDPIHRWSELEEAKSGYRVVFYRDDDVRPDSRGECGSVRAHNAIREKLDLSIGDFRAKGLVSHPRRILEIALEADYKYYQKKGSQTASDTISLVNQASGIYLAEYNVSFSITLQHIWTTSSVPFTSDDATTLLSQLRSHVQSAHSSISIDETNLFSGQGPLRLNGSSVVGAAYVGSVCTSLSYSVTLAPTTLNTELKFLAHEIGHTLDACHVNRFDCSGAYIQQCTGDGPLMCGSVQNSGPNTFSYQAGWHIDPYLQNSSSCLEPPNPPPPPPPPSCNSLQCHIQCGGGTCTPSGQCVCF